MGRAARPLLLAALLLAPVPQPLTASPDSDDKPADQSALPEPGPIAPAPAPDEEDKPDGE